MFVLLLLSLPFVVLLHSFWWGKWFEPIIPFQLIMLLNINAKNKCSNGGSNRKSAHRNVHEILSETAIMIDLPIRFIWSDKERSGPSNTNKWTHIDVEFYHSLYSCSHAHFVMRFINLLNRYSEIVIGCWVEWQRQIGSSLFNVSLYCYGFVAQPLSMLRISFLAERSIPALSVLANYHR